MKRVNVSQFDAYQVTVRMKGDLTTYALNFLKIFNTVKTEDSLIRVTNDYGDNVSVVCTPDSLEDTIKYLGYFGEVIGADKVLCIQIEEDIKYDYDQYDDMVVVPVIE